MTPEEAKKEAYDSAIESGEGKVASLLKERWDGLSALYHEEHIKKQSDLTDDDFNRMARELIDTRRITAPTADGNNHIITLKELDQKDTDQLDSALKKHLGVSNLEDAVPTRNQLSVTAGAVADGVEENTGSIGFLGGATIMNAIAGLMRWIGSGFSGGFQGLTEAIAQVSAENMETSVSNKLHKLRENRQDMGNFLTDDMIADAGHRAHNATLKSAGLDVADDAPGEGASSKRPFELGERGLETVKGTVKERILHPDDGSAPLAEEIAEKLAKGTEDNNNSRSWMNPLGWVGAGVQSKEDAMPTGTKIADVIAESVASTVSNPNYRTADGKKLSELDDHAFGAAISEEAGKALKQNEASLGLPVGLNETDPKTQKTYLDGFKGQIAERLSERHDEFKPVLSMVHPPSEQTLAQAKEAGTGAREVGTKGGDETPEQVLVAQAVSAGGSRETSNQR